MRISQVITRQAWPSIKQEQHVISRAIGIGNDLITVNLDFNDFSAVVLYHLSTPLFLYETEYRLCITDLEFSGRLNIKVWHYAVIHDHRVADRPFPKSGFAHI